MSSNVPGALPQRPNLALGKEFAHGNCRRISWINTRLVSSALGMFKYSSHTWKVDNEYISIPEKIHPANLCLAILAVGYLRCRLAGEAADEVLLSPSLLRFKRQRKMLDVPVWPKVYNDGIMRILSRQLQEVQVPLGSLMYYRKSRYTQYMMSNWIVLRKLEIFRYLENIQSTILCTDWWPRPRRRPPHLKLPR